MNRHIWTIKDLTDSAIMYHAKFPPFGYMLILIAAAVLTGAGIYMAALPRVLAVTGEGIVQELEVVNQKEDIAQKGEPPHYVIISRIKAVDGPRVQPGDEVQILVEGYAQSEYGCIYGVVDHISDNVIMDEDNQGYFQIQIIPGSTCLSDGRGEKINLMEGMPVETRIIYEKMSYLEYLTGLLGVGRRNAEQPAVPLGIYAGLAGLLCVLVITFILIKKRYWFW